MCICPLPRVSRLVAGVPQHALSKDALAVMQSIGSSATTVQEAIGDPKVMAHITEVRAHIHTDTHAHRHTTGYQAWQCARGVQCMEGAEVSHPARRLQVCVLCVLRPHDNVLLLHVLTMVVPCLHLSPYAALFCGRAHVCSVPGGELGPTLKLKRPVVVKKYHEQIDALYSSADE